MRDDIELGPIAMAIQIHGGYGYTRDFPVEQYWRDQRLNMIHEGTHGIQAADLLGRKAKTLIMKAREHWFTSATADHA